MRTHARRRRTIRRTVPGRSKIPARGRCSQCRSAESAQQLQNAAGTVRQLLQANRAAGTIRRQPETEGAESGTGTEMAGGGARDNPRLSMIIQNVERLKSSIRGVNRHQDGPELPSRVTEGGSTRCNPDTGEPEWSINRSRVPQCMHACAERHELTHVDFMRMPCERVWTSLQRVDFWMRMARQYAEQQDQPNLERAMREAETALEEARTEVAWFQMYMSQTCRYDEAVAYAAGIEVCNTDETRSRCAETGELDEYNRQMRAWRRFMRNPPNCPAVSPPTRAP